MDFKKLITHSTVQCPKDLFGELSPYSKETLEKIIRLHDEEIKSLNDHTRGRFELLAQWGREAVDNNTYNDSLPYKTLLTIAIELRNDKKFFVLKNTTKHRLFFSKLLAFPFFEGYNPWRENFSIKRGTEELFTGRVEYYGTHGAEEVFYFKGRREHELHPEESLVGDSIEFKTVNYASADDFAEDALRMGTTGFGKIIKEKIN